MQRVHTCSRTCDPFRTYLLGWAADSGFGYLLGSIVGVTYFVYTLSLLPFPQFHMYRPQSYPPDAMDKAFLFTQ